jgi:hypothetical protein
MWRELGEKSEAHALNFERKRLKSIGMSKYGTRIADRTKQPGYGFDFESFSSPGVPRYIEVKTFTRIKPDVARFFLSENELQTSLAQDKKGKYYFYLVIYKNGKLEDIKVKTAEEVYLEAEKEPQCYAMMLSV